MSKIVVYDFSEKDNPITTVCIRANPYSLIDFPFSNDALSALSLSWSVILFFNMG